MFARTRYQQGSLTKKKRKGGETVWEMRFYEIDTHGKRRRKAVTIGTLSEYVSESAARKSPDAQAVLLRINGDSITHKPVTVGALIARYEQEEMPERHSTRISYQSCIKQHIRPRWAETHLAQVKPIAVEEWLKALPLASKTKCHIRGLMAHGFSMR